MSSSQDESNFRVVLSSAAGDDYDQLVAEIEMGDKFVALISQEEGIDRLKIEFPGPGLDETVVQRVVSLDTFLKAVAAAKARLERAALPNSE